MNSLCLPKRGVYFSAFIASCLFNATAFAQGVTSSVYESQMYNQAFATQDAMDGITYNYIGVPEVSTGSLTYGTDPGEAAYTNTPGAQIYVGTATDPVSGAESSTFSVGDVVVNADTTVGTNHAEASVGSFNDPYFQATATSSWTNQFAFSGTVGNASADFSGDFVQFVFNVDTTGNSQITGEAAASLNVESQTTPDSTTPNGFSTNLGTDPQLGVEYSKYDTDSQGFFDPVPETSDTFSFSGGGGATLVTQDYLLTTNFIDPTVTLTAEVNQEAYIPYNPNVEYPYASGTANFSETASLAGILLYSPSGQLVNPDTYSLNYNFQPAVAPEANTGLYFAMSLTLLSGLAAFKSVRKSMMRAE